MAHPPLSTALHLVLSANLDQTTRPGLFAAMQPGRHHQDASQTRDVTPITRSAQHRTTHRAVDGRANVLTMPRVIPLPRLSESGEANLTEPDLDPDAA